MHSRNMHRVTGEEQKWLQRKIEDGRRGKRTPQKSEEERKSNRERMWMRRAKT